MLREILTEYLCLIPLGAWPEFCAQTRPGRRDLLATRDSSELLHLFVRTNLWYLRYVFHYLTCPLRRKPTFFLMGFPKCGTTYFADLLTLRSDIDSPTGLAPIGKETLHFRKDQVVHAFMPIRGFYPIFSKAEHLFDASVSYSYDPGAMTWIKRDYPDAKVILVVRDQISVFESMVNYYNVRLWRKGPKELELFENPEIYRRISTSKLCRAVEITNECQSSSTVTMRSQEIRDLLGDDATVASRFVHMLYDQWVGLHHGVFGESNVLVHDFAELTKNPARVFASTVEFLGLPESPAELSTETRRLKRNASRKVFKLNSESRKAIRDVFYPHNEKLRAMTDVDLNQHLDEATG